MRAPLLRILVPYAAGIALEDRLGWSPAVVSGLAAALVGAALAGAAAAGPGRLRRSAVRSAEALLGVGLGALALGLRLHAPVAAAGPAPVPLRVLEAPARSGAGCRLRVHVHGERPGRALLRAPESECGLLPGALALARIELEDLRPATNPGGGNARRRWARRGVRAAGRVSEERIGATVPEPGGPGARLERLRRRVGDALDPPDPEGRAEPETGARPLLRALVTGRRDRLSPEVERAFVASGTAHLLAVSGLHVGWVFAVTQLFTGWVLGRAGGVALARRARTGALAAGVLAAGGYAALAGFGVPALRATSMAAAGALAVLGGRPGAQLNALALAALAVLAVAPGALFDPGFALSFTAVAGILAWSPPPGRIAALGHATVAASLATAPWVAAIHAPLPAGALPANLVAVPWFGALVVPLGLAVGAVGAIAPDAAGALRPLAEAAAAIGIEGVSRLATPDLLEGVGRPVWTATALAAAGFALRQAALGRRAAALALAAVAAGTGIGALRGAPGPRAGASVLFLDVGHGDAALVRSGEEAWLVDAGPRLGRYDAGRHVLLPALRAEGVVALDALVITHSDRDHLGGAQSVLEAVAVGELWLGPSTWASPAARPLRRAAARRGVPLRIAGAGVAARRPGLAVTVLWPPPGPGSPGSNATSLVLRVDLTHGCVMLAGDVPARVERALAPDLEPCGVLKLAHHGSRTSTDPAWLARLAPEVAIASAGRRPRSPLPHPEVRARLDAAGVTLYETSRGGALRVRFTPQGPVAIPFRVGGTARAAAPRPRGARPRGRPPPPGRRAPPPRGGGRRRR